MSTVLKHVRQSGVVGVYGPTTAGFSRKMTSHGAMSLLATTYLPTLEDVLTMKG